MGKPIPHWTVTQLMERWQCTRDSVLAKIHNGQLRAINVGKSEIKPRYRVPDESLQDYELANQHPSWEQPPQHG
jgi:hypothetical protein